MQDKGLGEGWVLICYQRKRAVYTVILLLLTVLGTYGNP